KEMNERINGSGGFQVPEHSAVDTYLELAKRVPPEPGLTRKVVDLDINGDHVRIKGTTTDYDAIDKIVNGIKGGRCFTQVENGKTHQNPTNSEWNVTLTVDGAANAEGDPNAPAGATPSVDGAGKAPAIPPVMATTPTAPTPLPPPAPAPTPM